MDKLRIIILLGAVAIVLILGFLIFGNIRNVLFIFNQPTVTIHNHTFPVEVAQTDAQKEKGLSDRTSLITGHGMYFPFDKPSFYAFWMKDMRFPLDIIFIANGKVMTISSNLKPNPNPYLTVVKPTQPSNAVLEINAGETKKYGIHVGDSVQTNL